MSINCRLSPVRCSQLNLTHLLIDCDSLLKPVSNEEVSVEGEPLGVDVAEEVEVDTGAHLHMEDMWCYRDTLLWAQPLLTVGWDMQLLSLIPVGLVFSKFSYG